MIPYPERLALKLDHTLVITSFLYSYINNNYSSVPNSILNCPVRVGRPTADAGALGSDVLG